LDRQATDVEIRDSEEEWNRANLILGSRCAGLKETPHNIKGQTLKSGQTVAELWKTALRGILG
jgi:hypothetical protein